MRDIINLGMHPYADTFLTENQLHKNEPIYPLVVIMDSELGLIKTKYETDPLERYQDYSYTSSNSEYAKKHWDDFYTEFSLPHGYSTVLEIGSNDGYLAAKYKNNVNHVIGVDASREMGKIAQKHGVMPITEIFNAKLGQKLVEEFREINLIISNNVLNHADDLFNFIQGIDNIMSNRGYPLPKCSWVFEVPYWKSMIDSGRIDQIYHEHVTYFTVTYLKKILDLFGMIINSIKIVEYHGGSLRVVASKKGKESAAVEYLISLEPFLFQKETYTQLMLKIKKQKYETLQALGTLKLMGKTIVGIGAAAKGNTWLNYHKLDSDTISFVTDASPHKQGKYLPLSRIPVLTDEALIGLDNVYAIILSWNINTQLQEKLLSINSKIKFI